MGRLATGAAEGAAGAAMLEPLVYGAAKQEQDEDYSLYNSLMNIAFGTVFGGGLHVASGAIGDAISRVQYKTREAALRVSVAQLGEGRQVNVEPIFKLGSGVEKEGPLASVHDTMEPVANKTGKGDITTGTTPKPEGGLLQQYPEIKEISVMTREEFDKTGLQIGSNLKERWTRIIGADEEYRLPNLKNHFPEDRQTIHIKNPPSNITIYRAVPGVASGKIRPGDWIALDRSYAAGHLDGRGRAKIISEKVPAQDVVWAGTDENEFFYAPKELARPDAQSTYEGVKSLASPNPSGHPGSGGLRVSQDNSVDDLPNTESFKKIFQQEDVEASLEDGMRLSEQVDLDAKTKPKRTSNATRELEEDLAETMSRVDEMRNSGELDPEREAIMLEAERTTREVNTIARAVESAANCIATKLSI